MKNINNVLKDYRNELGMSLDELGRLTGIPKSTLSRYENNPNQKMDIKIVYEIAKTLKIPKTVIEKSFFEDLFWEDECTARIPVVGRVCAGNGTVAQEELIGHEAVESKYGTGEYFYLQVKGNSMSPKIDSGDIVLVKRQDYVEKGELAIVIVDDEDGAVKKVEYDDNRIKLISFNLYYPERVFANDEMSRVKIIGKVIESKRKW